MEKAFDTKELVAKLKVKGVVIAEDAAKILVEETLAWIEESVVMTPNKYDDFAVPVIETMKPFVMKEIDKIDGVEG